MRIELRPSLRRPFGSATVGEFCATRPARIRLFISKTNRSKLAATCGTRSARACWSTRSSNFREWTRLCESPEMPDPRACNESVASAVLAFAGRPLGWTLFSVVFANRAYDSDPLREPFATRGIELIAPHRCNRTTPRTQDGERSDTDAAARWNALGVARQLSLIGRSLRSLDHYLRSPLSYRLLHDYLTQGFEMSCGQVQPTSDAGSGNDTAWQTARAIRRRFLLQFALAERSLFLFRG